MNIYLSAVSRDKVKQLSVVLRLPDTSFLTLNNLERQQYILNNHTKVFICSVLADVVLQS